MNKHISPLRVQKKKKNITSKWYKVISELERKGINSLKKKNFFRPFFFQNWAQLFSKISNLLLVDYR